MILAAHTPDFFPAISFFQKMLSADVFVYGDDIQLNTHGQTSRTRINTAAGPKWLTIPVMTKGRGPQLIKDVRIANDTDWRRRHWRTLIMNYNQAAYFEKYDLYFEKIYRREWRFLIDLNLELLEFVCRELQITHRPLFSSKLAPGGTGSAKIIRIAQNIGCETYLTEAENAPFLEEHLFQRENVTLQFARFAAPEYHQQFDGFQPGLSVLDLLMNEGNEARDILGGKESIKGAKAQSS